MTKNSQLLIIVFISTAQLALMLLAIAWLFSWMHAQSEQLAQDQAGDVNRFVVQRIAERINAMDIRETGADSEDANKLLRLVGDVSIPCDGFVSIIDASSGKIIAHPAASHGSGIMGQSWDPFVSGPVKGSLLASLSQSRLLGDSSAQLKMGDSDHIVHGQSIPQLNAIVLSHRNVSDIHAINSLMIWNFRKFCFGVALVLGLAGTILNVFIVKRIIVQDSKVQSDLEKLICERTDELVRIKNAIIFGLAKLAESRDNDTGEHLDRIRKYVTILATDLASVYDEIDDEFIQNLAIASSLHDIGKVGIPDSILLKPGKLTTLERSIMEKHTTIGGECLEAIGSKLGDNDFLEMAREVAYWHHEQWDGNGYPHRLTDEQIPISARIVAVADVYDALTSRRPYKRGLTHTESRAIILSGSGQKFDPEVVASFLRHETQFQTIARRFQNVDTSSIPALSADVELTENPPVDVAESNVS